MTFQAIHPVLICACLLLPAWSEAKSIQSDLTLLAQESGKAVVNISTVRQMDSREWLEESFRYERPGTHQEKFAERFRSYDLDSSSRQHSMGSGFLISPDGYIVTNSHLIDGAEEVVAILYNEREPRRATVVGLDPETDLALIKIDAPRQLPTLTFADSAQAKVGDWVIAIGNPFGLDHSVTLGIISAKGRVLDTSPFDDFIQTDVSVNPGNSGGPLLNLSGGVVGINTAFMADGQGISFAVPSSLAMRVIQDIKTHGRVVRGWLGVSVQDVNDLVAKALGLPSSGGALISSLIPDAAADKAGLRVGDVILRLGCQAIENATDLLRIVAAHQPGYKTDIVVWRNGTEQHLTAFLGCKDDDIPQPSSGSKQAKSASLCEGLTLRPVIESESKRLGFHSPHGLLVLHVEPNSSADNAGLRSGDFIMQATRRTISSLKELESILDRARDETGVAILLIKRDNRDFFITMTLR